MRLMPKPVPTSYGVGYSWQCDYYVDADDAASAVPMAVFQRFEPFPKPPWTLHRTEAEAVTALLAAWGRLPVEGQHQLPEFASKVEAMRAASHVVEAGT